MSRIDWKKIVSIDPDLHHGEPCIKGTRVPVSIIVGSIADGMTFDDVITEYPQLTNEAIRAALAYAAEIVRQDILLPLAG